MIRGRLTQLWAYAGIALVLGVVTFLFVYIFVQGAGTISWEFLTTAPSGAVLGEEGGIWPAILGSFAFTLTAIVIGGIPAIATAIFMVFYCPSRALESVLRIVVQCIAGIPSIVLGLFAYSLMVVDLGVGRCVLTSGIALGIMIMPFIEVRAEKSFYEIPGDIVRSSYALGCSKAYTLIHIVLPACRGELVSGIILGGCYAMGAAAPLIFTGGVAYSSGVNGLLAPAMALPLHLYLLVAQGTTSLPTAYGTAFVMMAIILVCNILATLYLGRTKRA